MPGDVRRPTGAARTSCAEGAPHAARSRSPSPGPDLAQADAYSTAALALGADAPALLAELDAAGFPSLLVRAGGEIVASASWPGLNHRPARPLETTT